MMAYIDTKYLFKCETCRNHRSGKCDTWCDHGEEYIPDMNNIPTADVEEVKHAKWEIKSETYQLLDDVDEEFYVECPLCNRVYYVPFESDDRKMLEYAKKHYPYCNCGAKMSVNYESSKTDR